MNVIVKVNSFKRGAWYYNNRYPHVYLMAEESGPCTTFHNGFVGECREDFSSLRVNYRWNNLCPHNITYVDVNGKEKTLQKSGEVAFVKGVCIDSGRKLDSIVSTINDVRVYNLPDPSPGAIYVVSTAVAMAAKRADVVSPVVRRGFGNTRIAIGFQSF